MSWIERPAQRTLLDRERLNQLLSFIHDELKADRREEWLLRERFRPASSGRGL